MFFKKYKIVIIVLFLIFWNVSLGFAVNALTIPKSTPVIHNSIEKYVQINGYEQDIPVWVFFRDKGVYSEQRAEQEIGSILIPERAMRRRAKVMKSGLKDFRDLPVHSKYVQELVTMGLMLRQSSKWLNAVSGMVPVEQLELISNLDYVKEILLLGGKVKIAPLPETKSKQPPINIIQNHMYYYGTSLAQLDMIHVTDVHDMGLTGKDVLICITDTGFKTDHIAFENIDIVDEYDFFRDDNDTENDPAVDHAEQHNHGTKVLSLIGAEKSGELYGSAFGASFLLAKTEDMINENAIEEDYWVAAVEWADSLGADIVSCSVGYMDWYTYENMDGNTSPMTIAADIAVSRGIIICTSAGNERDSFWRYITVPADGDSVISVGAVDSKERIAGYSSAGPTFDGRIKPEIVAMGTGVKCVDPDDNEEYVAGTGTSYSAPIVAGVCALLLEAHPSWTPMQVREALMMTASRSDSPDNLYGWGIVNALDAVNYQTKGDVNGDDLVDRQDITETARLILSPSQYSSASVNSADVNNDGTVNILDVIQLVNSLK